MQFIAYLLIYPILWIISILPFRLLYMLSDVLYVFIYKILRYRISVVTENLQLVFPEKSQTDIIHIRQKFYKHFCDLFLEMIKTLSISKTQLNKRFIIKNPEAFKILEGTNTSGILMFGHYASYEWSIVLQSFTKLPGLVLYKKVANAYFDKLVRNIRSKYNSELVNTKKAIERIETTYKNKDYRMIAFLSDQSPKLKNSNVWLDFMGITVPCFIGAEATAKKYNFPVGFLKINKVKRGHYESELVIISENPSDEEKFAITKQFNALLEAQIRQAPEYYLWTHKRWKHRNKAP